jgi:serine/threonine protein kinase
MLSITVQFIRSFASKFLDRFSQLISHSRLSAFRELDMSITLVKNYIHYTRRMHGKKNNKCVDEDILHNHLSYTTHNENDPQAITVPSSRASTLFHAAWSTIKRIRKQRNVRPPFAYPCTVDVGSQITCGRRTSIRVQALDRRYVPIRFLGSGGNCEVNLCRDTSIGTLVAVKTIHHHMHMPPPTEVYVADLLGQHPHVVHYHAMVDHPGQEHYKQLIFEFCELGDLADYVSTFMDETPEIFIWHVFNHVSSGLNFIHNAGIVHGDLKPPNILLTPAREWQMYPLLKLADFGASTLNPPYNIPQGHLATLGWQPPEAEWRYGSQNDVWALGCVIHELAARHLPIRSLGEPGIDPEEWFDYSGKIIPPGTKYHAMYKRLCYYMAHNTPAPLRIDRPPTAYSKLLNYFMMRTLEMSFRSRITADKLCQFLPVLESLVHSLLLSGQESILSRFDDGRDSGWRTISRVTDSSVFEQIFYTLALRTRSKPDESLVIIGRSLFDIMDLPERTAAYRYDKELNVSRPF